MPVPTSDKIDDDLAFAVAPALEIDVAHAVRLRLSGLASAKCVCSAGAVSSGEPGPAVLCSVISTFGPRPRRCS